MSTEHTSYNKFIQNKYYLWYCRIIQNALERNLLYDSQIHEKHHCLPESLGGKDLVILTFREHYLCHELLIRFTQNTDKMKMCFALHTFFHFNYHKPSIKKNSILYESHKKIFKQSCQERIPWIKKESYTFKNKKTNEIFEGTRNDFIKHTNLTNQEVYNLITKNSNNVCWHSKNWGIFNKNSNCFSYDLPRKKSIVEKVICPHCNIQIDIRNYKRWHDDKCKLKKLS